MLGVDTEVNKNTAVKQKCSNKGQRIMVSVKIEAQAKRCGSTGKGNYTGLEPAEASQEKLLLKYAFKE